MVRYKKFSILISAVSEGGVWHARGVILDPQIKLTKRVETFGDFIFLSKQEADAFALKLCKAWIDRAALQTERRWD